MFWWSCSAVQFIGCERLLVLDVAVAGAGAGGESDRWPSRLVTGTAARNPAARVREAMSKGLRDFITLERKGIRRRLQVASECQRRTKGETQR